MIKIRQYDEVVRFDLARTLPGGWQYWTAAYLVDGMLVDTGCAYSAPELAQMLVGKPLARILNTHSHEDHIGANGLLQAQRGGLEICAHPLALQVLTDPRRAQPLHPYRRLFWGWPKPSQGHAIADGLMIETDHHRFHVIYTPGHSVDHLCLYEPEQGWLFTGDLFVGGKDRALRAGCDIWQIIASLKCVVNLPATRLFPGSAQIRDKPRREIQAKIHYLEDLGDRILQLHYKGWTLQAIVRKVCGGPMWVEFVTLGHFSRQNLVLSYLGMDIDP